MTIGGSLIMLFFIGAFFQLELVFLPVRNAPVLRAGFLFWCGPRTFHRDNELRRGFLTKIFKFFVSALYRIKLEHFPQS